MFFRTVNLLFWSFTVFFVTVIHYRLTVVWEYWPLPIIVDLIFSYFWPFPLCKSFESVLLSARSILNHMVRHFYLVGYVCTIGMQIVYTLLACLFGKYCCLTLLCMALSFLHSTQNCICLQAALLPFFRCISFTVPHSK